MADTKQPSFFSKVKSAIEIGLDQYVAKARSEIAEEEDNAFWRKSVYRDVGYQPGTQGWLDKGASIGFGSLRQMALKDTIVAAIIQTRQNQAAAFTRPVDDPAIPGFRIVRKKQEKALQEMKEKLFGQSDEDGQLEQLQNAPKTEKSLKKAGNDLDGKEEENETVDESPEREIIPSPEVSQQAPLTERQKLRIAKQALRKQDAAKIENLTELMINCGALEDRPFQDKVWDFNAWMRAEIRDTMTYDLFATETVLDQAQRIHHWAPADGSTVRILSPEFLDFDQDNFFSQGYDILYPEKELEALEQTDAFRPDPEKMKEGDYKYAQVVRGRIERVFTPDELSVGMRNMTSDIYANGYSISELELLIGTVTSHIFTENYNNSYFQDGFSAKGILHIKAPINRRKLETIRIQWKHMLSGPRNAFHTPIFSGMEDIQWIPLTQNHSDMEFSNWMNYLIKIICSIYQIDPSEIGFGMRDEGGGGGGLNGDNTEEKIEQGRDKGLRPLMLYIQNFINKNIIDRIDDQFELEFCGLEKETPKEMTERQQMEIKFKKTVNEIREENNLQPIPFADELILDPTYLQFFMQFNPDARKIMSENQQQQGGGMPPGQEGEEDNPDQDQEGSGENQTNDQEEQAPEGQEEPQEQQVGKSLRKSKKAPVVIEYYLPKD